MGGFEDAAFVAVFTVADLTVVDLTVADLTVADLTVAVLLAVLAVAEGGRAEAEGGLEVLLRVWDLRVADGGAAVEGFAV